LAGGWWGRTPAEPGAVAGAFRVRTHAAGGRNWLGPLLRLADLRSRTTRFPYGDQAVFVRREAFHRAGGFPDQPLMEDVELARRLRRVGRIRIVPAEVQVSGRRFLVQPVRAVLAMRLFPTLYRLGVPPQRAPTLYRLGVRTARRARLYGTPR